MSRTYFVLKSIADFAPGAFENTAMEEEALLLGRSGISYLPSGCYTSPPFSFSGVLKVIPCWNADTPQGTAVETQVRVACRGQWSKWFSFGKWSPFIERATPPMQQDELAHTEGEAIVLNEGVIPADMVQARIFLYSDDSAVSPQVRLLGVSGVLRQAEDNKDGDGDCLLEVPRYSCLVRDPAIAARISSATSLTMMMNRWGEDALPEEVARSLYDYGTGRFGNMSFLTAGIGGFGYECYLRYASVGFLRKELRHGYAVAVLVRYRTNFLENEEAESSPLPVLDQAVVDSEGHFVVLRGFLREENEDWVVVNDPMAHQNDEVERKIALSKFKEIYMGLCIVLRKGSKYAGSAKPTRLMAELKTESNGVRLLYKGEVLFPSEGETEKSSRTTVCFTLPEKMVFASAAQKKFYYMVPGKKSDDSFRFFKEAAGEKVCFYWIGPYGTTYVAEKAIPQSFEEKEPEDGFLETEKSKDEG